MEKPTLLPDPACLHLRLLDASAPTIIVKVSTTAPEAACPLCQRWSDRVHSRYVRQVADLPWMGCAVQLEFQVRRFFCSNPACPRQIFTERLPTVVAPYARRTTRLTDVLTLIGFALGGEAGRRLVAGMGLTTSPDTLLRLLRAAQEPAHSTPRVLGVDDFSFCRRKTYGTLLVDLEKRVPVDLLPNREGATLAAWLREHPGVHIVRRDRAGPSAEGIRQGAPDAQQIADRWHRLANLSEALQRFFLHKQAQLKALVQQPSEEISKAEAKQLPPWYASRTKREEEHSLRLHQERVERYRQIRALRAKQVEVFTIARRVGRSRSGVYDYLRMRQPPERTRINQPRKPLIAPYTDLSDQALERRVPECPAGVSGTESDGLPRLGPAHCAL